MLSPRYLLRALAAAAGWAPHPGQVGVLVLLAVALVLGSEGLGWVGLALCAYGIAYDLTAPDLLHEYCPCPTCTTPPTETGDSR